MPQTGLKAEVVLSSNQVTDSPNNGILAFSQPYAWDLWGSKHNHLMLQVCHPL